MDIDYAKILKTDRMHQQPHAVTTAMAEFEHDRSRLMFSPALHRLQHLYPSDPPPSGNPRNSKLTIALQAAQIGRNIATRIAAQLEQGKHASRDACAALINVVECASLLRHIGDPPFGRSGEAAIRRWFADFGPIKIRAACRSHGQLSASDARVSNALADFTDFGSHPQSLRVLAKFHWGNNRHGLDLCKATLAAHIHYLRIAGSETTEHASDQAGFFSTEAGMMKSIWSAFGYDPLSQRFPLNYIVEVATDIAVAFGDLEHAIDDNFSACEQAVEAVKNAWMSSYIPADPDSADEEIMNLLSAAGSDDVTQIDNSFGKLRDALIDTLCDYATRQFIAQQEAAFAGTLVKLLSAESGCGALLTAMQTCQQRHNNGDAHGQQQALHDYATLYRLLTQFGVLLESSTEQFQTALANANKGGNGFDVETRLLSVISPVCRSAYTQLVAQLGQGRDVEFEEWNARAHLVVDHIAGLTDESATASLHMLDGG